MPLALRQQSFLRVRKHDRSIGRARRRRHVARVLLVSGRVGDDEFPPRRGEVAIGDIDGNALFALGLQSVGKQGQVDLVVTAFPGSIGHGGKLVAEDLTRIVQESSDQRALAVVDAARRDEPQNAAAGVSGLPPGRIPFVFARCQLAKLRQAGDIESVQRSWMMRSLTIAAQLQWGMRLQLHYHWSFPAIRNIPPSCGAPWKRPKSGRPCASPHVHSPVRKRSRR